MNLKLMLKNSFSLFFSVIISCSAIATPVEINRYNSVFDIIDLIENKNISCEKIIKEYTFRILNEDMRYDHNSLTLNSIVYVNPFALESANKLDMHFRQSKQVKGRLHCVPIIIKDNIHTKEMPTQVGSYSMMNSWPPFDATLIKKLRAEGAIILAKAAMAEFAMPPPDTNTLLGITGNAYDTNLTPGGSSGGVASAVSRGFGVTGIGSDNSGSIRGPAGLNGLLGLRPSYGYISSNGTFPLGEINGVFGPITYDFKDLVTTLNILSGPDPNDERSKNAKLFNFDSNELLKQDLKSKRIGIIRKFMKKDDDGNLAVEYIDYEYDSSAKEIFRVVIDRFKELGLVIVDNIDLGDFNTDNSDLLVGGVDFINAYLIRGYSPRESFKDLCASNRTNRFGSTEECLKRIQNDPGVNSTMYRSKLELFDKNQKILDRLLKDNNLDAFFYLVQKPYYPEANFAEEHFSFIASNAGSPAITIRGPMTNHKQLRPTFFQLISAKGEEEKLLTIISQYEEKWHIKRPEIDYTSNERKFDTISDFNNYKQTIGLALYQYMKINKLDIDNFKRSDWHLFLQNNADNNLKSLKENN